MPGMGMHAPCGVGVEAAQFLTTTTNNKGAGHPVQPSECLQQARTLLGQGDATPLGVGVGVHIEDSHPTCTPNKAWGGPPVQP